MSVQVGNLTRLQCVKAAVINQLKQLRDDHPTRKVALVTFETQVSYCPPFHNTSVIGDAHHTDYRHSFKSEI